MGGGVSKALGKIIGVIIMKRALIFLLIAACVFFYPGGEVYPQVVEEKDLGALLKQLEQKISEQEKVFDSLKAKQSRIVKQKLGLLALIEQDKKKIKEKEEKAAQQEMKKKQREAAQFLKGQKARDKKPASPEKEDKSKNGLEEKERFSQEAREFQMKLILEKEKKTFEEKDITYLENLIKRQRELCAAVIQLQIDVTAEEKNLKLLKEGREFLLNPK